MPTPKQIRAARALLGWSQTRLALMCGLSKTGLLNIEAGKAAPQADTLAAIRSALEAAGIEFCCATGVRLREEGEPS